MKTIPEKKGRELERENSRDPVQSKKDPHLYKFIEIPRQLVDPFAQGLHGVLVGLAARGRYTIIN